MATSGTTAFNPALSDLVLAAFGRLQIRPVSLTSQHMLDARLAAQLLQVDWANEEGPSLWEVDLVTVPLAAGTATYPVNASTLTILDAFISTTDSGGNTLDRPILPISRNEYAAIPSKKQQGPPTCYWLDRQVTPRVTLWAVPESNTYTLSYYRVRQIQDASLPGGATLELPYRFLSAFTDGLAAKLALTYPPPPPNTAEKMDALAQRSWKKASDQDIETGVPISVVPTLGSYYR